MCVILIINSNLWVTWISNEIYRAVKWKIGSYIANICGLSQVNNVPTRTWQKSDGTEISSCINWHILTNYNVAVSWAKEISILLGCSANNWMEQHLLSFVVGIEQTAMMHKCLDCLAVKQTVYSCVYCCKKPVILYKNVYFSANRHDCSTRHGTWVQFFFSPTKQINWTKLCQTMKERHSQPKQITQEMSKIKQKKKINFKTKSICPDS